MIWDFFAHKNSSHEPPAGGSLNGWNGGSPKERRERREPSSLKLWRTSRRHRRELSKSTIAVARTHIRRLGKLRTSLQPRTTNPYAESSKSHRSPGGI